MYNNEHNRYVLEVLQHKIVPFVKEVKIHIENIKKQSAIMMECDAEGILKAINKLDKAITQLILKEAKKKRNNNGGGE